MSRFWWNRARPWHTFELVSFLVGLRTYQHPGSVCGVISSVFVCGGFKRGLGGTVRERSSDRHVTGQWLVTVTSGIASEMHCRKSVAQAGGFWVDQVATLQANRTVSTPPVASALLITASNRNPSCVRSHEKVGSWSMWPRDQQVHRKRLSDCTSWNTSSCWARQELPTVVENTEVSVPSLGESGSWPYWKATHVFTLYI